MEKRKVKRAPTTNLEAAMNKFIADENAIGLVQCSPPNIVEALIRRNVHLENCRCRTKFNWQDGENIR